MDLYISLFAALVGGGLFSWFFLPAIRRICYQKKLFDSHDERKVHVGIVPRLGGFSFLPSMVLSLLLVVSANVLLKTPLIIAINTSSLLEWLLVLSSTIFLYLTGIADDLIDVGNKSKLVIQVIAALLFTASGIWINSLHGLFGLYEISPWIGIPLTVTVIVFIINAYNFIDGIDGLAAGIAMIAFLFFGLTLIHLELYIISIMAFAAVGMLIPFFYFNIFGKASNQSKIFMGDSGSLTIGMMLAAIAVKVYHSAPAVEDHSSAALVLGFSALIVPVLDASRVIVLRLIKGQSPFMPDRNHMHHVLLDLGFSHRIATLIMLTIVVFFGAICVLLAPYLNINLLVGVVVLLWLGLDFFFRSRRKHMVRAVSMQYNKTIAPVNRNKPEPVNEKAAVNIKISGLR